MSRLRANRFKQWWCGKTGHHYNIEVWSMTDYASTTYVMDPLAQCNWCHMPLPQEMYDRINKEIEDIEL